MRYLALGLIETFDRQDHIFLVQLYEITAVASDSQMTSGDVFLKRDRGFMALSDSFNGKSCSAAVAADKDIFLSRLESEIFSLGNVLSVFFKSTGIEAAPVDCLTDGRYYGICFDNLKFSCSDGFSAASFIGLSEFHDLDLETGGFAVLPDDLDRTGKETEFYSLRQGIFIFLSGGGHLIFGTAIDNSGIRSETDGRTASVHCNIAGSDDDRLLAECGSVSEIYCSHEIDSGEYVLQVFARNTEFLALLGADSDCEALIALISELLDRYVFSYFNAASEFDAKLLQYVYLGIEDILLQSEAGDACHQHTAGNRVLIEDRDIHKACCCKEICGSHAGGACSDNGYLFFKVSSDLGFYNRRNVAGLGIDVPAGYEVLDIVDRKSLVDIASRASILASLVAYTSAYGGEGIHFLY